MNKYKIKRADLVKMYSKDFLSIEDISKKIGCSSNLVYHYIRKFEIPVRRKSAHNLKNLLGMKFTNLLVIEKDESRNGRAYWICKCDCGNRTSVRASHLTTQQIKSCGCIQFINHWKGYGEISGEKWNTIRQAAIRRGLSINITLEYLWDLYVRQDRACAISGEPIIFSTWYKGDQTASLDRIDNDKGYEIGNVQWVHKEINKMKGKLKQNEFIDWCRKVANHSILN